MKKIDLSALKRNARDIYFGAIGIALLICTIVVFAYSVSFLVSHLNQAISVDDGVSESVRFNTDLLPALGIEPTATSSN